MHAAFAARLLSFSLLLLCAQLATADDLYTATVPVLDNSSEQRASGLRQALAEVLVRITGDRQINTWGDTEPLLSRADALVQSYGFEPLPPPAPAADNAAGPETAATAQATILLRAAFDGRAVERELRQAGLPVWGARRPQHLLWLALRDDGRERSLIDQESAAQRVPAVLATATQRGLPVSFPLLDLQDRQSVDFADVGGGFAGRIAAASERYGSSQIVSGAVGREGGLWVGRFSMLDASGATESWVSTEQSLEAALIAGIHSLADRQAGRLAVRSSGMSQSLTLKVSEVANLYDYARVLKFLEGLNAVRGVQVTEMSENRLQLRLRFDGDPETLERAIAIGRVLVPSGEGYDAYGQAIIGERYSYRLAR